jgi:hypothetical protein
MGPRESKRLGATNAQVTTEELGAWLLGRLPENWFVGAPRVSVDHDEILIIGQLSPLDLSDAEPASVRAAETGRISRFREETREDRMKIAQEGQFRFGRAISWGVEVGTSAQHFTTTSVPVMTRLRQAERTVLDTLVDSGVARSRSDALAWCVKLVASNADEWLLKLRQAMESVEEIRQQGPTVG